MLWLRACQNARRWIGISMAGVLKLNRIFLSGQTTIVHQIPELRHPFTHEIQHPMPVRTEL